MRTLILSALSFLFTASLLLPQVTLWQKAVLLAKQNDHWVPGQIVTLSKEVDKKGRVKDSHEVWIKIFLTDENTLGSALLKSMHNGEDVTEREQKAFDKAKQNEPKANEKKNEENGSFSIGTDSLNFFHPDKQKEVTVKPTYQKRLIASHICLGFDFTATMGEERVKGRAWLMKDKGVPLEVTYTLDPLPKHVSEMNMALHYAYESPDKWVLENMSMQGVGGFLFIKKRFSVESSFSDYWLYEEKKEEER